MPVRRRTAARRPASPSSRVAPESWQDSIEAIGTVKARESVVISAKQSERVAAVRFESGQRVAKGQVLIELDAGTVKAELAEARATLADLDAQVTRLQSLQSRQLIAQSQLDTAVASRNAARARAQAANERLNDRIIRAPFSGVLGPASGQPRSIRQRRFRHGQSGRSRSYVGRFSGAGKPAVAS